MSLVPTLYARDLATCASGLRRFICLCWLRLLLSRRWPGSLRLNVHGVHDSTLARWPNRSAWAVRRRGLGERRNGIIIIVVRRWETLRHPLRAAGLLLGCGPSVNGAFMRSFQRALRKRALEAVGTTCLTVVFQFSSDCIIVHTIWITIHVAGHYHSQIALSFLREEVPASSG